MDWLGYGDVSGKLFYTRIKQRKLASYICTLRNEKGENVEGFAQVDKVLKQFYQSLMVTRVC